MKAGITRLIRGVNKLIYNIGGDSETKKGPPITYQFVDNKYKDIIWTSEKKSFNDYIGYCDSLPKNNTLYIIWIHNLNFDMVSFFYDRLELLAKEEIDYYYNDWHMTGIYSGNVCFLKMVHKSKKKTVYLLDTGAFFMGSLERLALLHRPDLKKLKRPKGLGQKSFKKSDKEFVAYAMRDSEIALVIGEYIVAIHEQYDIPISVSIAQMAAKIFRKNYVHKTIHFPPMPITYAAQWSYHGGKNGLYVKRGLYKNVYGLDIVSAYPHAMRLLPSFTNIDLYMSYECRGCPDEKKVPNFGIYKVKGTINNCTYPILFTHDFKRIHGNIDHWVTGWELNEAIKTNEVNIKSIYGYYYDADNDDQPGIFKDYVSEFFNKKDTAKNPIDREFYKILLNSLYGKFIQTNRGTIKKQLMFDETTNGLVTGQDIKAGGLYNPFIATLITGHTRAYLHQLEHKYKAIHSSTDGIICKKPLKKENKTLGGLTTEFNNDVYIVRNKLYIVYSDIDHYIDKLTNKKVKRIKSKVNIGKYIEKCALHGFAGDVKDLENMIIKMQKGEELVYNKEKRNTLKRSLKSGDKPNNFEKKEFKLHLKG